jgi:hypothetical protein
VRKGRERGHDLAAPRAANGDAQLARLGLVARRQGMKAEAVNANHGEAHVAHASEDRAFDGAAIAGVNGHLVVIDVRGGDDQAVCEDDAGGDAATAVHLHDRRGRLFNGGGNVIGERGPSAHASS